MKKLCILDRLRFSRSLWSEEPNGDFSVKGFGHLWSPRNFRIGIQGSGHDTRPDNSPPTVTFTVIKTAMSHSNVAMGMFHAGLKRLNVRSLDQCYQASTVPI